MSLYLKLSKLLKTVINKFDSELSKELKAYKENVPKIEGCIWEKERTKTIQQQIEEAYECKEYEECILVIKQLDKCYKSRSKVLQNYEKFVTSKIIGEIIPKVVDDQLNYIDKKWKKSSHKELGKRILIRFGNQLKLYMAELQSLETKNHRKPIDLLKMKKEQLKRTMGDDQVWKDKAIKLIKDLN